MIFNLQRVGRRPKIRVVDFFSGCGGTSAGLRSAGMTPLVGLDSNANAASTFRKNFPEASFIEDDICNVTPEGLSDLVATRRRYPVLFSSCAPCQPFSAHNRARVKRIDKGTKSSLLDEVHRFIRYFNPEYLLIENVPGLQKTSPRTGPFRRLCMLLGELSYWHDLDILRAQDFGVPQYRRRLVLIASRLGRIKLPTPTHGPGRPHPYSTVWDWIGGLPRIKAGGIHPTIANHRAMNLSDLNLDRLRCTPEGGGRNDWPKHLQLACHQDHSGHSDVYGRMHKRRPASALTTKCLSLSNGRFGHPTQNRAISGREAACLQTFDRDFMFDGSLTEIGQQIGNAVPVKLAEVLGEAIIDHFAEFRRGS